MPKVFVCHRREDTADVAGRIFDRLVMTYGGQQILKDLDSIPLGVDFREYIGRMVGECDVFLAVIGPRWLGAEGDASRLDSPRDFVRIEIESALAREIPIVPLFVGGASMPSEEDIPESIRPFVYRNGVPVRPDPDFHRDIDRVLVGIDGFGRPAPPAATAAPSRPEPIPRADPDWHHDDKGQSERTDAEAELATLADKLALTMLADQFAVAKESHRIDAEAMDLVVAGLDGDRQPAARPQAATAAPIPPEPKPPVRKASEQGRDAAASDIETAQCNAGTIDIPPPTTTALAPTILIVSEDEVQAVKDEPGIETNIRVFADTDVASVLPCISRERPRALVLGRAFVGSSRGAALVNAIKTDHTLAATQIRVISRASDYLSLVRRTDPLAASDDAMPGEPLPADYLGTRQARRYKLRPGFKAQVDGNAATLVDLSGTGARLVGSTVLRLQQRVRLVLGSAPEAVRCSGSVVWVSFEPRGKRAPRYTAGAQFVDVNPKAIEDLALRHLQH